MIKLKYSILITCLFISFFSSAQNEKTYRVNTVAFYNLENLFDPENDPKKYDEASPIMEMAESLREEVYAKKLTNMAKVIAKIGADVTGHPPAVLGVCEVENRRVLEDLLNESTLVNEDYGIVHFDSPDKRGIDVALLYKKSIFRPINTSSHELLIYDQDDPEKRVYTRDQLLVTGLLDGDKIHFIVNHWPSRSGGEARSRFKREKAAALNKKIIDSLQAEDPYAKIITMGDLNDGPYNTSVKEVLGAKAEKEEVKLKGLYNPMENMQKKGIGTIAYRDSWDLFDQMILSQPLLDDDYSSYRYYKAGVYNPQYLANPRGRYKGYPYRSFSDGGFSGGYSDHFPVYVYLVKEVRK
ncbi:endonuclease/exonuclease/phosphatase family protein [Mesonia sp.]|uniref:endonuclease/exonuclease/phosphatase family protein n=1 Tax=Mesonia sp. TaxID=1960830 RepID=UPI001778660E|nr:endonuclease/exonuclease/phosphatase family protein [Mesonia sp.]HIB36448.1 endonuclease/exonuclease/phosphatase family protein [Mesonia sp.]HIO27104.1 endonuclease/exonuclease/phosphatase family protein [Flavobacteriaceae bacterium]